MTFGKYQCVELYGLLLTCLAEIILICGSKTREIRLHDTARPDQPQHRDHRQQLSEDTATEAGVNYATF